MVYYLLSEDGHMIYMGKDKFENEKLLKWAWPEDIWFHVDDYSSAHVYLRLNKGETIDSISKPTLEDCGQLVKKNSIEGSKKPNVKVVYTEFLNLLKTSGMEIGSVTFKDDKKRKFFEVEEDKDILKRMKKTMEEKFPDLEALKIARDQEEKGEKILFFKAQKKEEIETARIKKEEEDKWKVIDHQKDELYTSNKTVKKNMEDDFM